MLKLEFPSEEHCEMYEDMIQEWGKSEKIPTSPGKLFYGENFDEFLSRVQGDVCDNERGVDSTLFFLIDGKKIAGGIQIRHHIDHPNLIEAGGHVGYGILPKYRSKGYATKILELGLEEAKKLGIDKVLVCCYPDNIGSNKAILSNGGIFERVTKDGGSNRYWIEIK